MLRYTPLDTLALDVKRALARDLGLAGLVAEDVYGLGELLSHALVLSLEQDAELHWLLELLNAFNSGKIDVWRQLSAKHAAQIAQHPSVAQNLPRLEEKARLHASSSRGIAFVHPCFVCVRRWRFWR